MSLTLTITLTRVNDMNQPHTQSYETQHRVLCKILADMHSDADRIYLNLVAIQNLFSRYEDDLDPDYAILVTRIVELGQAITDLYKRGKDCLLYHDHLRR